MDCTVTCQTANILREREEREKREKRFHRTNRDRKNGQMFVSIEMMMMREREREREREKECICSTLFNTVQHCSTLFNTGQRSTFNNIQTYSRGAERGTDRGRRRERTARVLERNRSDIERESLAVRTHLFDLSIPPQHLINKSQCPGNAQ